MNKLVDTDIAVTTTTTAQNNDTDNHNTNNDGSKNKNARNKNNNRTTEDSSRKCMEQEQDDPKKPKIRQVTEIISQVRKTGQHPPEWKLRPPREHECIAHGSDKQVPQGSPPSPVFQCCCKSCWPTCEIISAEWPPHRVGTQNKSTLKCGGAGAEDYTVTACIKRSDARLMFP